jgi:hypothetical protein
MACSRFADRGHSLQIWRVAASILNKKSQTADSGWSSSLGVGRGLTTPHHKTQSLLRNTTHSLRPDHLEDQGIGGWMGSEWILGILAGGVWIGFDWLRIGTDGELLWIQCWTFWFLRHGVSLDQRGNIPYEHSGHPQWFCQLSTKLSFVCLCYGMPQ